MARGKLYKLNYSKVERTKKYSLNEALAVLETYQNRKFDESIEVAFNLGVDAKQSDQLVRGATALPHGIGKSVRVVAVVRGEAEKLAKEAGADAIGNDDIIEKIEKGWLEFDKIITTPETLKDLTKVAKILGPKGLMPNKKDGTVVAASEVGKSIKEQKLGKVSYKVEKAGILHAPIGKKSFGPQKLKENFLALYDNVLKAKPTTSKGIYVRKVSISPTMGPSIILDTTAIDVDMKAAG